MVLFVVFVVFVVNQFMRSSTFFLLLFLAVTAPLYAQSFEELKTKYLSLRNTDIEVTQTEKWESLGENLVAFADKNPGKIDSAVALYDAALVYDTLYTALGGSDRLIKCVQLLQRIASQYPGHERSDDALVKVGELKFKKQSDVAGAKAAFEEVVKSYPDSDMYDVARTRLKQLSQRTLEATQPKKVEGNEDRSALSGKRKALVVLDPGHGGEDFGAVGVGGLLEKDVVLDIALKVENELKRQKNIIVRLTRRTDRFVPLAERTNLANDFEADLFVSIHVNASPGAAMSGLEAYYLDNTKDLSSKKLAERENQSLRFEDNASDLNFMLSDLIQSAKLEDSLLLANVLYREVKETVEDKYKELKGLGVKKAPFYVLVGAHMPCSLIELFFIDHKLDGVLLAEKDFRLLVAQGLATGIYEYLARH